MGMNEKGFTLIELMVVVAIVGVLASIAIPQYMRFAHKAQRAEQYLFLDGHHKAQQSYFANQDDFYHPGGGAIYFLNLLNATAYIEYLGLGAIFQSKMDYMFAGRIQTIASTNPGYEIFIATDLDGIDINMDQMLFVHGASNLSIGFERDVVHLLVDDLLN